jgi:Ferric uptake regulator family
MEVTKGRPSSDRRRDACGILAAGGQTAMGTNSGGTLPVKGKGLLERLRQRRWRMTPQRRVIAEVLAGEHVHFTADEVHARAAARLPEISRATVYNTLNELVKLVEVLQVSPDGGAKRYDPNATDPHHHLAEHRRYKGPVEAIVGTRRSPPRVSAGLSRPAPQVQLSLIVDLLPRRGAVVHNRDLISTCRRSPPGAASPRTQPCSGRRPGVRPPGFRRRAHRRGCGRRCGGGG